MLDSVDYPVAEIETESAFGEPMVRLSYDNMQENTNTYHHDGVNWTNGISGGLQELAYAHMNRATRRARRGQAYVNPFEVFTSPSGYDTIKEEQPRKEFDVKSKSNSRLKEWSISARALKNLISRIVVQGEYPSSDEFVSCYKFGAIYNQRYQRWFIYNKGANNNIATLKISSNRLIVRYREKSFYSSVLSGLEIEGLQSMVVASTNLHRHNRIMGEHQNYIENNENGQMEFRNERKREYDRKHNK